MPTETRTRHFHYFYGSLLEGYRGSFDPHLCGDDAEPCLTITETREVSDWKLTKEDDEGLKSMLGESYYDKLP